MAPFRLGPLAALLSFVIVAGCGAVTAIPKPPVETMPAPGATEAADTRVDSEPPTLIANPSSPSIANSDLPEAGQSHLGRRPSQKGSPLPPVITPVEKSTPLAEEASRNTVFARLLMPLQTEVSKRRAQWQKNPAYVHRINTPLNYCRLNILLFGFGVTHEPPAVEWAIIGSPTIISLNLCSNQFDIVSLTHDIWSPEVRAKLNPDGKGLAPRISERISEAYRVGGFPLMKLMLENATGLSIDLEIAFKDSLIRNLIDEVFHGVEVEIPRTFRTQPFYMGLTKYQGANDFIEYKQGVSKLDGTMAVGFIKAVPLPGPDGINYDRSLEHNRRKELVFQGLRQSLLQRGQNAAFWSDLSGFLFKNWALTKLPWIPAEEKEIDFDLAAEPLAAEMLANVATLNSLGIRDGVGLPQFGHRIYIVDPRSGDGGVHWWNSDTAMEVPLGGNPDGDLVSSYWGSVRRRIEFLLTVPDTGQ